MAEGKPLYTTACFTFHMNTLVTRGSTCPHSYIELLYCFSSVYLFSVRDGLFTLMNNASAEVLVFPPHNDEIFHGNIVTSDVKVVIDGGRCLEMFFEPLTKCPRGLTNVFITFNHITLVSVYDSTFSGWYLGLLEPLGGA